MRKTAPLLGILLIMITTGLVTTSAQGTPSITILQPQPNTTVNSGEDFIASGTISNLGENQIEVEILTTDETRILSARVTEVVGTSWSFRVASAVLPGGAARVFARVLSPDGTVLDEDSVPINIFGEAIEPDPEFGIDPPPAISILQPNPNTTVGSDGFVASGTISNLDDNQIEVSVVRQDGTLVTAVRVNLVSDGTWTAGITTTLPAGPATVVARVVTPDGASLDEASLPITISSEPTDPEFGVDPPPAISILQPNPNTTVGSDGFVASGTISNLDDNQIEVSVVRQDGTLVTAVRVNLVSDGTWTAGITTTLPAGPATVVARVVSPDGASLDEASLPITISSEPTDPEFGIDPPPAISILQPNPNTTIPSDAGFVASGTITNLDDNQIEVSVVDQNGGVVVSRRAEDIADGAWTVSIFGVLLPGGQANVVARVLTPEGAMLNEASVPITVSTEPTDPGFGIDPPPFIFINSPAGGSLVDTAGFDVAGTAQGIFEGNVIVRARDRFGRTLSERITTADLNGDWRVNFNFLIADETSGSIYAFSPSPVDGRPIAETQINLIYASNCVIPTNLPIYTIEPGDTLYGIALRTSSTVDELVRINCMPNPNLLDVGQQIRVPIEPSEGDVDPAIEITSPEPDAQLQPGGTLTVTGNSIGTLESAVFVRVLNATGEVIDLSPIDVTETRPDGSYDWVAELDTQRATPDAVGTISVHAFAPEDTSLAVIEAINVVFGAAPARFITISDPVPYSRLDTTEPLTLSGTGGGLFENNVVVRAVDQTGNTLAESPTIVNTDQVGGTGEWQVTLPVDVAAGTRGQIVAFSPDAATGGNIAEAAVDVIFGDPREASSKVFINVPLPRTIVSSETENVSIVGYANGVFVDQVLVTLTDQQGIIRFVFPAVVDGLTGNWIVIITPEGLDTIQQDESFNISVAAISPNSGSILSTDRIQGEIRAD